MGADEARAQFRLLCFDRQRPHLAFADDGRPMDAAQLTVHLGTLRESQRGWRWLAEAYAIIGVVALLQGHYLVVVTQRRLVGELLGHAVYAATAVSMLPVSHGITRLTPDEARYLKIFERNFANECEYLFSYTYLLPASLQAQVTRPDGATVEVSEQFTWNHYLLEVLASGAPGAGGGVPAAAFVSEWCTPIVQGFFGSRSLLVPASGGARRHIHVCLLARRSRHFAGTRFLRRGVNADGHVANEVETELIVADVETGAVSAVTQLRGSAPVIFAQINVRSPKPGIAVGDRAQSIEYGRRHFRALRARYSLPIVCLSLIKQSEKEERETRVGACAVMAVWGVHAWGARARARPL